MTVSVGSGHPSARGFSARLPREVWILSGANVMIALGYGVISPVMPAFARSFGVSITAVTLVITVFSLTRLFFAPASGMLVQRWGERRIYLSGLLIVAIFTAATGLAHAFWQVLVFRAFNGIGSTMFFVSAFGLMIHISPPDERGRIAGVFSTSFMLGAVGGPVLGGLMAGLGLKAPFLLYGGLLLVLVAVLYFSLRHSSLAAPALPTRSAVTLRQALRHRAYQSALFSNFATGWSTFGLRIALVPLFVSDVMGRGIGVIGLVLAAFAGGNALAVIPSGYLSDKMGRRGLMIVGLTTCGLATIVLGTVTSLPAVLAAAIVAGATSGIFMSPLQASVADILGSEARSGPPVAAVQMSSDLGAIVGSLVIGPIAEDLSFGWDFDISGIILLIAAAFWVVAPETRVTNDPAHGLVEPEDAVEAA
jgi:MFS family permease